MAQQDDNLEENSSTGGEISQGYDGPPRGRPQRSFSQGQGQGQGQGQERGGRRSRFQPRRKVCIYCADKDKVINWKRYDQLRRFIGDSGEIYPRRKSGLCARHQRSVAVAIKRARQIALLPYTGEHLRVTGRGGSY